MDSTLFWHLTAAGFAFMLPAGLILVAASGMRAERAWDAALGGLAAFCLGGVGYWAFGFAFQFGSVGFLYTDQPGLSALLRGWTPLPEGWGVGWIAAGLEGWFLTGPAATPTAMGLFLAHAPWAMAAALMPVLALRGRAPALATLAVALVSGGIIYPLAGNWVQGGGLAGGAGAQCRSGTRIGRLWRRRHRVLGFGRCVGGRSVGVAAKEDWARGYIADCVAGGAFSTALRRWGAHCDGRCTGLDLGEPRTAAGNECFHGRANGGQWAALCRRRSDCSLAIHLVRDRD